jgi:NADPH-dependent 2,4-dienoyl-CoA reductase/sulfur reductase-like enzyme
VVDRLVVIGGDAGGMTAVSQVRSRRPNLEIVALERTRWTSYSACGIPFYVGGEVDDLDDLVARSPQQVRDKDRVDVRVGHEAKAIDLDARTVEVRDLDRDRTYRLGFEQLLIGTGGRPIRPPLPGIDLDMIHGVQTLDDADRLVAHADAIRCRKVVVVGGGYIGLEMAEAFVRRGAQVVLVERNRQPMTTLDPDLGALVATAMRRHGVDVRTGTEVTGFEPGSVHTTDEVFPADLVVLGIGVLPNSALAAEAGLALGAKDAISVDRRQHTSAEGVWAAGDCCESTHLISGEKLHIALGTVANKQSRVAGINIGGGYATFPGVLGTAITKVCDTEMARTGLSLTEAERAGFSAEAVTIEATTKAGYYPGTQPMTLRLIIEHGTHRLLGAQIVGGDGAAKRIDVAAVAITAGMTADDVVDLDLAYAPPFASVWDPLLVGARQGLKVT